MKNLANIVLILCLLVSTSCAALFNGSRGKVQVNSNPSGAEVFVDGVRSGKTPILLKLDSRKPHVLTLKNGGKEESYTLNNKLGAGWIVLDVLGGLAPIVIDAATGAWYTLDPREVNAQL